MARRSSPCPPGRRPARPPWRDKARAWRRNAAGAVLLDRVGQPALGSDGDINVKRFVRGIAAGNDVGQGRTGQPGDKTKGGKDEAGVQSFRHGMYAPGTCRIFLMPRFLKATPWTVNPNKTNAYVFNDDRHINAAHRRKIDHEKHEK